MKNLFESLEDIALQIFTEDRAADYFGSKKDNGTERGLSALATQRAKNATVGKKYDINGPSVLERASKHLSGEAKEKAIEHTKKMEENRAARAARIAQTAANRPNQQNYTPTADANDFSKGSKSPTKLAVLAYQRWAFGGFTLQEADDFIEEFQKEFGDYKYNKLKFFYKLGTGDTWRGVATFKNIDQTKIKKVIKDIGNDKKIDSKDSRLQFIMQEGGKQKNMSVDDKQHFFRDFSVRKPAEEIQDIEGEKEKKFTKPIIDIIGDTKDEKEVRKRNKTFIFSRHHIHYVIPLPIFGGYKKYARFIKFTEPVKVASGITVSELFLMDASEFSGEDDTTYIRGLYYFDGFDRFVTIADNFAKYMYMITVPEGIRRMKNNPDFGLAYQSAILQIVEILHDEYNQTSYQPNYTDINNVILKLAKSSIGVWTPELLAEKLPSIYVQKIIGNIPQSTEDEIESSHERLTSFDKEGEEDMDDTDDEQDPPDIEEDIGNELEISEEDL